MNKIPCFVFLFFLGLSWPVFASDSYSAGGVSFSVPNEWEETKPASPLRLYQFKIPGAKEGQNAELAVFYFGANQGGDVEENINRWIGQYGVLNSDFPPERKNQKVGTLDVTTLHVEGTLKAGMPGMPEATKTDYATLAAVANGPQGFVFFKMTGPKETIRNAKDNFSSMISGLKA